MRNKNIVIWSNVEPLLEGTQQSLSSPLCLNLKEYNKLKNEVKKSTSHLWAALKKLTFY
jgi:hypothetical protein